MLLDDWKKYTEEHSDERMQQICKLLTECFFPYQERGILRLKL